MTIDEVKKEWDRIIMEVFDVTPAELGLAEKHVVVEGVEL